MKLKALTITFLSLAVGCAVRSTPSSQEVTHAAAGTNIEERIFIPANASETARLYLILTVQGNARQWDEVVVRHAKDALAAISAYGGEDVTAVFFIRPTHESDTGAISGFTLKQLVEIIKLPETEARLKVSEHAWGFQKKPKIGQNKPPEGTH